MGKSETKNVVQCHHVSYDPEVIVRVRKCEHLLLTRLQWYCKRQVSKGFLTALEVFVALNRDRAKEV